MLKRIVALGIGIAIALGAYSAYRLNRVTIEIQGDYAALCSYSASYDHIRAYAHSVGYEAESGLVLGENSAYRCIVFSR